MGVPPVIIQENCEENWERHGFVLVPLLCPNTKPKLSWDRPMLRDIEKFENIGTMYPSALLHH